MALHSKILLLLSLRNRVRVNRDALQPDLLQWPVLRVHWHLLNRVQRRVRAVDDLAEDCVLAVQTRLLRVRDEELRVSRTVSSTNSPVTCSYPVRHWPWQLFPWH